MPVISLARLTPPLQDHLKADPFVMIRSRLLFSLISSLLCPMLCDTMAQGKERQGSRERQGVPPLTLVDGQRWVESELNQLSPLSMSEELTRWSIHRLTLGEHSSLCVECAQSLQRETRWVTLQRRWCTSLESEPSGERDDIALPSLGAHYCWGKQGGSTIALTLPGSALPPLLLKRALSLPESHTRWMDQIIRSRSALPVPPPIEQEQRAALSHRLELGGARRCRSRPRSPMLQWLRGFRDQLRWIRGDKAHALQSAWSAPPNVLQTQNHVGGPPQVTPPGRRLPFALQAGALRWLKSEVFRERGRLQRLSLSFEARLPRPEDTLPDNVGRQGLELTNETSEATLESLVVFTRQSGDEVALETAGLATWLEQDASAENQRSRAH